jgi:Arsenate reductase and related proteins, glutaredoxin family
LRAKSIAHNPRSSKSRKTSEIMESQNMEAEIILYLQEPPSASELSSWLKKLGIKASELPRKSESTIKELKNDGSSMAEEEWISMKIEHPIQKERPIGLKEPSAIIGRPPENGHELI